MKGNQVSFVIPNYNHFDLINQLLVDIKDHNTPDEILIVDDCSTDQTTIDGLAWWEYYYKSVKVIRPPENLGFLKASNFAMKQATGDIVCLISTDVRVEFDLAKQVRDLICLNNKLLIGGKLYTESTGWNNFILPDGKEKIYPYLEGWLLCATKKTWEDLGYFDERFVPNDFEDVQLSTTAIEKGYAIIPLNNPMIRHTGGQSIGYTEERKKITEAHRELFRSIWITPQAQQSQA